MADTKADYSDGFELTIDGSPVLGVERVQAVVATPRQAAEVKYIGRLPSCEVTITQHLWGASLEMLCRGLFGLELLWTQCGRNGGYIGETDEELVRRTRRRLSEWPRGPRP